MFDSKIDIPLNRGGEKYYTDKKAEIIDIDGKIIAESSIATEPVIYDSIKKASKTGFSNIHNISIDKLLDIVEKAGNKFGSSIECGDTMLDYTQYQKLVVKSTGLPIKSVRKSTDRIKNSFRQIKDILEKLFPFETNILDSSPKNGVCISPKGKVMGVNTSGNIPASSFFWVLCQASKYPIIERPSTKEPFTNQRLAKSLFEAGLPKNTNFYLPCSKNQVSKLLYKTDIGMTFGPKKVVDNYKENSSIKTFGPGNSKIFIDIDYFSTDEILKHIINSIMERGSRSCLNASQLILISEKQKKAKKSLKKLGEKLSEALPYTIKDPLDNTSRIPCFPNHDSARKIEKYIKSKNKEQIINKDKRGKLLVEKDKKIFLKPTLIILNSKKFDKNKNGVSHSLFREFPFPYLAMVAPPKKHAINFLKNSLVVSLFTEDKSLINKLILDPTVKKLRIKRPTTDFDFGDPHEGNITNFLYIQKSIK